MAKDDLLIICSPDADSKTIEEFARNISEAMQNAGGLAFPVYVSRCNWKPVNKEDILNLKDELVEICKINGWSKD